MLPLRKISKQIFVVLFPYLALNAFAVPASAAVDDALVVTTSAGRVRGVRRPSGRAEFLGIPYARPPVGNLRWREPAEVQPWSDVRDASSFGVPCAQPNLGDWNKHDAETGKEDCLFLNVITPVWPSKSKLPVMFWLHGGANAGGTASSPLYKDGTLVEHGIILVTVNYRLGIFGFFAHPDLTRESEHKVSGNYGLLDQIAALRWVRKNIAQFGGDPDNITVFGQSAGALDTSLLMVSPLSRDLFQRAIAESGSALMPVAPLGMAERAGAALAKTLKAPEGNTALAYLRARSAAELLDAAGKQDPNNPPMFTPVIDGYVFPESPQDIFAAGKEAAIPMLFGTTTREFAFTGPLPALRGFVTQFSGELAPRALDLYGLANGGQGTTDPFWGSVGNQWMADQIFRCPAISQALFHHAAKHPTYQYQFEHAIPGQENDGAVHSADLPYVFGFYPKSGNISGAFTELDFRIADQIESYWTNFARAGNPNGGALPHWPELGDSQQFISITQDGRVVRHVGGLRPQQCELSREIFQNQKRRSQGKGN